MKKSKLSLLLLAMLAIGVVSGCKGNGNKPSSSFQSSSSPIVKPSTSTPKEDVSTQSSSSIKAPEVSDSTVSSTPDKPSTSTPSQGDVENPEVLENKVKEKYRISPNQKLTPDNQNLYEAPVGEIKNVDKVEAIKFTFSIDFNGVGVESQWWGGEIYVDGKATKYQSSTGTINNVDANYDNVVDSTTQSVFAEVSNLNKESIIKVMLYYAGGNYDFYLSDITYYYSNGLEKRSESKEYDLTLFENGATGGEIAIPLSDFENRSPISKVDLEFYSENEMDYIGGTVFFTGVLPMTESNILNVGDAMVAEGNNTATISIYLEHYLAFDVNNAIQMVCYWAPAKLLKLTKVTLYTDVVVIPKAPENVEAHAGNREITLEWTETLGASTYEVYVNNELYAEVGKNYCVIDGLTNGQSYEFYVVSKNVLGVSDKSMVVTCSPDENVEYNQILDGLNTSIERMLGKTNIQSAYRNSIVSANNNYRLKTALNKIKRGENATISYIGGSVTVGEGASIKTSEGFTKGYASYATDFINEYLGSGDNVKYINSAISGTGSEIGIVRLQEDVLDYNPDIVFVEFAVNNGYNDFCNDTYEGVVRKLINDPSAPAVVLLFSWSYYSGSKVEEYMTQLGNHYKLPMVSIHQGLHEFYNDLYDDFVADDVHPNDEGYKLYAKLISNFITQVDKAAMDEEYVVPSSTFIGYDTHKYDGFEKIKNNGSEITSTGSFDYTEKVYYSGTGKAHVRSFDNCWVKSDTASNDALTLTVNAKNFILVYKSPISHADGTIVIHYENVNKSSDSVTITQNLNYYLDNVQTGWDNPISILLFDKEVAGTYNISISMQNAGETATILAMGYTK